VKGDNKTLEYLKNTNILEFIAIQLNYKLDAKTINICLEIFCKLIAANSSVDNSDVIHINKLAYIYMNTNLQDLLERLLLNRKEIQIINKIKTISEFFQNILQHNSIYY
jgi:hypothetical protein